MKKVVLLLSALFLMSCGSDDIASELKNKGDECAMPTLYYNVKGNSDLEITNNTYKVLKGDKLVFEYISVSPKCVDKNLVEQVDKKLYFEVPSNVNKFEYTGDNMWLDASAIFEVRKNDEQILFDYATKGFIKGQKVKGKWNAQIEVEFKDREGKVYSLKIEQTFK